MKLPIAGSWRHSSPKPSSKHTVLCLEGLNVCQHVLVLLECSIEFLNAALVIVDVARGILVITNKCRNMIHKRSHSLGALTIESHHEQFLLNIMSAHSRICSTIAVIDWICMDLLSITKIRFRGIRTLSQNVGCLAFKQ